MATGAQKLNDTVSGNPYIPGLYRYPNHLDSKYQNHKIRFDIFEVTSTDIDKLGTSITSIVQSAKDTVKAENANQSVANAEGQSPDAIQKLKDTATKFVDTASLGTKKVFENLFGELNESNPAYKSGIANSGVLNAPTKKTTAVVELYTPDTLDFSSQFAYSSLNINDLIASVGSGILGSVPKVGSFMQGALASLNGEGTFGNLVKLGLNKAGYAINSQQQLMFQGVEFRSFGMAFVLTPTDEKEAQTIRDIVKTFRRYSSPEIVQNTAGFLFKPPAFFEISFHHNGAVNDNIPKLLRCVCTGIEVNYAPNGWSAYKDGHPAQITMGLSFQETTILDRNKIDQGY
jgi:hypothetical protein